MSYRAISTISELTFHRAVTAPGIFIPATGGAVDTLLIGLTDGGLRAMFLASDRQFQTYLIGAQTSVKPGFFFADPLVEVDLDAAYDPLLLDDPAGSLIIRDKSFWAVPLSTSIFEQQLPIILPTPSRLARSTFRIPKRSDR